MSAWMQLERLEDFHAYASEASVQPNFTEGTQHAESAVIALLPARHACNSGLSYFDLDWCPPETKGQLGQWGSSLGD